MIIRKKKIIEEMKTVVERSDIGSYHALQDKENLSVELNTNVKAVRDFLTS